MDIMTIPMFILFALMILAWVFIPGTLAEMTETETPEYEAMPLGNDSQHA